MIIQVIFGMYGESTSLFVMTMSISIVTTILSFFVWMWHRSNTEREGSLRKQATCLIFRFKFAFVLTEHHIVKLKLKHPGIRAGHSKPHYKDVSSLVLFF